MAADRPVVHKQTKAEQQQTLRAVGAGIANELFTLRRLATVIFVSLVVIVVLAAGNVLYARKASDAAHSAKTASSKAAAAAEAGDRSAKEAKATADFIRGCIDPKGECGGQLTASSTAAAERRKADLDASLADIKASQSADNARLLAAVEDALAQLAAATDERDAQRHQIDQLLAEISSLRAQLRALGATGATITPAAVPPPTTPGLCAALGALGPVVGCPV